jgi:NitT/TauT family transport system substrate-binding protein
MYKRYFGLLLALALLLSACQSNKLGNTRDSAPLQIAYAPLLGFTPLFVAADKGYFAEQGLQVELKRVRNIDEMLAPLSTGKLDISLMAVTTGFFNGMNQKLDFRVVAGADAAVGTKGNPFLLVSKALSESGAVRKVADLKGRKLAINLRGSALEYMLGKGLEKAGLTLNDVELVTIPGTEMQAAIANGAVDGAVVGALNAQRMIQDGVAVSLLADADVLTGGQGGVVVFGQRLLQPANREVAIRVLAAYLKAVRELNDGGWQDPGVISIMQKYTGMEPALIERSAKPSYNAKGALDEASIQDMQAFQISRRYVEYSGALPLAQMANLTFVSEAVARLEQK